MVRISVLTHKFRGKDRKTKKGLQFEILSFVLALTRVFRPGMRLYSRFWGGQAVFWGDKGPEMHSIGNGHVTFFWGTILAWWAHFLLGGAQAVI